MIGLGTPPYVATPISAVLRPTWTAANWVYHTVKHEDPRKRRVHSFRVMLMSALPLPFPLSGVSNGAYLLSIMEESPEIGLAMADNLVMEFTGRGLRPVMRSIGSYILVKPFVQAYRVVSSCSVMGWLQRVALGRNPKKAHDTLLGYLTEPTDA